MKVTFNAYAKLNLTLDVTEKRPDNYHNILSVFQSVGICDTISVTNNKEKISINCNIGLPEKNTCFSATKEFFTATCIEDGVAIEIEKRIPVCAGLGGGSADAGALLHILNFMYGEPLDDTRLCAIAAKIGADVPFCLYGGTAKVSGIGDKIKKLPNLAECKIIIIKNGDKPSTSRLYKSLDEKEDVLHPDCFACFNAIENGDITAAAKSIGNVFENVWGDEITDIKTNLIKNGALNACLSGSGPSVFGIFNNENAEQAYQNLKEKYTQIYLCDPMPHGYTIENIE